MPGEETTETDSRSQRSRASRWGGQVLTRPRRSRSRAACPGRFLSDAPNPTTRPYESRHRAQAVRDVIPNTNAIESLNYQLRKVTKTRGSFPTDEALLKLLYLAIRNLGRTDRFGDTSSATWHWRAALNQFELFFPGRLRLA